MKKHIRLPPLLWAPISMIVALWSCGDMSTLTALKAAEEKSHVYIGGLVGTSSSSTVPVYWKDGALNYLPLSAGNTQGWAYAVTEDNSGNVYVLGSQGNQIGYWKNSTFVPLSLGTYAQGFPISIAVDTNGNIWVLGEVGTTTPNMFAYWENSGSPNLLPGSSVNAAGVRADTTGNVYITGAVGTSPSLPCYWKNGANPTLLPLNSGNIDGYADHLAVDSSGNLYMCGAQWGGTNGSGTVRWEMSAGVWQGAIQLSFGEFNSNGSWHNPSMAIDSFGNAYIVREYGPVSSLTTLVYWKGLASTPAAMSLPSGASLVAMSGAGAAAFDVYGNFIVAGTVGNTRQSGLYSTITDGVPICWKNGSPINLPMGSGNTFGMAGLVVVGP